MNRTAVIYPESKRIACALLQAMYGGDIAIPRLFDTRLWQPLPMQGGVAVSGTMDEWRMIAERWNACP
jgi:hypothetical protein